jgi:hypothetical protein
MHRHRHLVIPGVQSLTEVSDDQAHAPHFDGAGSGGSGSGSHAFSVHVTWPSAPQLHVLQPSL